MNFSQAVVSAFKRAFDFKGRSSRSEYWYFRLFEILYFIVYTIILSAFFSADFTNPALLVLPLLGLVSILVLTFIWVSLYVRRLHDINKSGWYLVLFFILGVLLEVLDFQADDIINIFTIVRIIVLIWQDDIISIFDIVRIILLIWQIVWLCWKGDAGENRFGPNPLTQSSALS